MHVGMAYLDVFALKNQRWDGLVVEVQSPALAELNTRVVVPLKERRNTDQIQTELNPMVDIDGVEYVLLTEAMFHVVTCDLRTAVASFARHPERFASAFKILFGRNR